MNTLTKAAQDVLAERQRQIEREGYDQAHDDEHGHYELSGAAAAYAAWGGGRAATERAMNLWPWEPEAFKPLSTQPHGYRRNYVRAAALLLAAIERMDRAAAGVPVVDSKTLSQNTPMVGKDEHE